MRDQSLLIRGGGGSKDFCGIRCLLGGMEGGGELKNLTTN